jgi:hypothetical protein
VLASPRILDKIDIGQVMLTQKLPKMNSPKGLSLMTRKPEENPIGFKTDGVFLVYLEKRN